MRSPRNSQNILRKINHYSGERKKLLFEIYKISEDMFNHANFFFW